MLPDRVVVTVIRGGGSRGVMGGCGGSAWVPNSATGFCCHCPKTYELANNRNRNSLLPPAQASPCGWGTTTFLLSWTVPWQPLSSHGFLGQNLCLEIYTLSKAILPQNTGLKKKNWFTPPQKGNHPHQITVKMMPRCQNVGQEKFACGNQALWQMQFFYKTSNVVAMPFCPGH